MTESQPVMSAAQPSDEAGRNAGNDAALPFPSQASMVRRTDLRLRAWYPQLVTRIFEVEPHRYQIFFDREDLEADAAVTEHFDKHLRPPAVWIDLTNTLPCSYVRELSPIADRDIAANLEGFQLTFDALHQILAGQMPSLPAFAFRPTSM